MIIKNGEKFDPQSDPSFKEFREYFAQSLSKGGVTIKVIPTMFDKIEMESDRGLKKLKAIYPIKTWVPEVKTVDEKGSQTEWKYFEKTPKLNVVTKLYEGKPSAIMLRDQGDGIRVQTPRELEKAWFIWRFYSRIKGGKNEEKQKSRHAIFYVESKDREAVLLRSRAKQISEAETKIWNLNDSQTDALYQGVFDQAKPVDMNTEQAQVLIVEVLKQAMTADMVLDKLGIGKHTEDIEALIREATELELIVGDETGLRIKTGGPKPAQLAPIPMEGNWGHDLKEYLGKDEKALSTLKKAINKVKVEA